MADIKPTIVLVHGAWHSPAGFDSILPLLHAASYITTAVSLPSVGVSPGHSDFTADVEAVQSTVRGLTALGQETVVVTHSYSGVVASEGLRGLSRTERKLEGLPGGVVKMVHISSILPKVGTSLIDYLGQTVEPDMPVKQEVFYGDGTYSYANSEEIFYNDLSPELAKYYSSLLRPQSLGTFMSPLTYEGYRHIPSSYLICANDNAISRAAQERIAEDAGIETIKTISSSHSPFLSQPELVVNFIRESAE